LFVPSVTVVFIGHTRYRTIQKYWQHWAHKIQNNPEILATLGTQDTGQSRNIGNIGHTRYRTIQKYWQHWAHKKGKILGRK
jgi:hypothetical protein